MQTRHWLALNAPLTLLGSLMLISSAANAQEFSYNADNGPGYWSSLNAAWSVCNAGGNYAEQSSINITKARHDSSLKKLDLETYPTTIDIFNNGHTIEQHYEGTGSSIYFSGIEYELK